MPTGRLLGVVALVALLGVLLAPRLLSAGDPDQTSQEAAEGQEPAWEIERPLGQVVQLDDGAVARVNALEPDVTLAPGSPQPEPDTRLVRADVEVCAGEAHHFAEPAFWLGLGDDNRVHSPHLGVRDFRTFSLAPGTCQRGDVDLALPAGVELEAVLLMDQDHETVGTWAAGPAAVDPEPLRSEVEPAVAEAGDQVELSTSGTVTLHAVTVPAEPSPGGVPADEDVLLLEVDAEVCASEQDLYAGATAWLLQTDDHRLLPAQRSGASIAADAQVAGEIAPGECGRGTIVFAVPADAAVETVAYATGGMYEEARWRLQD